MRFRIVTNPSSFNRIEQTVAGAKTTYSYDANDRLIPEDKAGVITNYTYDNQGNTLTETKAGQVTQYGYNAEHELVQTSKAGISANYSYNLNGIRTEQTVNGVSTHYLNDNNMPYASVLMAIQNQQPVATYTYGDDLISYHQGTGSQYYLYDGLGSTRALANTNGQVTDTYTYDAYGETLDHQGSSNNAYQYTGEQKDATDNYYLRARYYNPSVGRFTQMDTYMGQNGNPITLHKYLYANASPTMYTDPSGHMFASIGFSFSSFATMTAIRYGAVHVGRTILGGVTRQLTSKTASHVGGATIAGLVYVTATNYCQKTDNCQLPVPIIFYGLGYYELSNHILDAQLGNGSNSVPISALLHRKYPANGRSWLNNKSDPYSISGICPIPRGTASQQCDEYPFNSSQEGGKDNYPAGVSLRMISTTQNKLGGINLGGMYSSDGTQNKDPFLVLTQPYLPLSFYITRKGKFKLF